MDSTVVSPHKPEYVPDKGFWMQPGFLIDGIASFNNSSRMESKRSRQSFFDAAADSYLFPGKKQAVEAPISKQESRINMSNELPCENSSIFQSLPNQITDGPLVKNVTDEHFVNNSCASSSISHAMEDLETRIDYGGIKEVKVDQVNDPRSGWRTSVGPTLCRSKGRAYTTGSEKTFIPMEQPYGKEGGDAGERSMGSTFGRGISSTISFGSYQDIMDYLSRPVSSYSLLYEQPLLQTPKTPSKKDMDVPNGLPIVSPSQTPKCRPESTYKTKPDKKPAKKAAPNSFLTNVKRLTATGMFDGVPVRYVSVSQEDLRGIIKGSNYLCGCHSCSYSKTLNAYEFEEHAGCKTSHPNNHIHFENGKSIHQVVQVLKSTPQSMLFDAIQTVTGSPINQKAFQAWKESFQAATQELRHIYVEGELNL